VEKLTEKQHFSVTTYSILVKLWQNVENGQQMYHFKQLKYQICEFLTSIVPTL